MAEQRFPFRQLRRRRRQPANIAASGASNQTDAMREQLKN
jgi:hypothetical protein